MASRSGPFFDLEAAAAVGRRLTRGPVQSEAPSSDAALAFPVVPELRALVESAETAAELWQRVLEWAKDELRAFGVFVLDEQGFVIATTKGGSLELPPEIFSAALAEGRRLFSPYMAHARELQEVEFGLGQAGRVVLSEQELSGGTVLLGLWSVTGPVARRVSSTWRAVVDALALYDRLGRLSEESGS